MKRIIYTILLLAIVFSLASCAGNNEKDAAKTKPDIDFTGWSSTMIAAEISNIYTNTLNYEGKIIKISGEVASVYSKATDQTYHYLIIYGPDRLPCCNQNLEFVSKDGKYPEDGTEVTIIGSFETYSETYQGKIYKYIHLNNSIIL